MKKFLFSAVALIGFTVASYGANTVDKVEVKEVLLVEEKAEVLAISDHICVELREIVYEILLFLEFDENEACESATALMDICFAQEQLRK